MRSRYRRRTMRKSKSLVGSSRSTAPLSLARGSSIVGWAAKGLPHGRELLFVAPSRTWIAAAIRYRRDIQARGSPAGSSRPRGRCRCEAFRGDRRGGAYVGRNLSRHPPSKESRLVFDIGDGIQSNSDRWAEHISPPGSKGIWPAPAPRTRSRGPSKVAGFTSCGRTKNGALWQDNRHASSR